MADNYRDNRLAHYSQDPHAGNRSKHPAVWQSRRERGGDRAKVGGHDYSGMTEDQVRASRVDRIKEIFAGLKGKAAKQAKPAGSKPRAPGGKTGGSAAEGRGMRPIGAKDPAVPPMPPAPQATVPEPPGFYERMLGKAADGLGYAAAAQAMEADPGLSPAGAGFYRDMVNTAVAPMVPQAADYLSGLRDQAMGSVGLGMAALPGGAVMDPGVWDAVAAAAPYIPRAIQSVTAPAAALQFYPGHGINAVRPAQDVYGDAADAVGVLGRIYKGLR